MNLPNTQDDPATRLIPINRVGVHELRYPVNVLDASGRLQAAAGLFTLDVSLAAHKKGTHLSRFIEGLEQQRKAPLNLESATQLLQHLLQRLDAEQGRVRVHFTHFIRKKAPVSQVESSLDYELGLEIATQGSEFRRTLIAQVPVTTLCPCSKAISKYGAHNQRSLVKIEAEVAQDLGWQALIDIAEQEASCPLWSLLKRADEKYVTERAYDNPCFVEDLARAVAERLNAQPEVLAYTLTVENFESIHNHIAFAQIAKDKG